MTGGWNGMRLALCIVFLTTHHYFSAVILEMPAKSKPAADLTLDEHYKLVDEKLAALMNAIPAPKSKPVVKAEAPEAAPRKASAWSQRVSAFYKEQKANNPSYSYKQALIDMKGR